MHRSLSDTHKYLHACRLAFAVAAFVVFIVSGGIIRWRYDLRCWALQQRAREATLSALLCTGLSLSCQTGMACPVSAVPVVVVVVIVQWPFLFAVSLAASVLAVVAKAALLYTNYYNY